MAIASCLTLSLIHIQISLRFTGQARLAHFFFSLSALAVAITGSFELALLLVDSVARYNRYMFWAEFPLVLMMVSLAGFTWFYLGKGRRWMLYGVVILSVLTLLVNMAVPPELRIRHAVEIRTAQTFGGVLFTLPRLNNGPVSVLELAANSLLVLMVVDASMRAWRMGKRRQAVLVGGSIVFFLLVSRQYAGLVEAGLVETPYFFILPFLALLIAMGRELSLDVFRSVRLAEQLQESERQVDLAARAATLGFWRWDMRKGDLWATESARILFAISAHEALSFDVFIERVHPEDRDSVRHAIAQAVATGQDYEAEYRVPLGGANVRWIVSRGRVDQGDAGPSDIMRGVVIDITDRKQAQSEVENMRKELAHVSRVSIMGELAGSLAHELNQPLAAILSNAQAARWLLDAPGLDVAQMAEIMDDIIRDDKRAGEVIHRLRGMLQKRDHVASETIDVNEVAQDVARLLNSESTTRNVEVVQHLAADLPPARASRVEMQQVLLNLMVNAMDAMRDQPAGARRVTLATGLTGDQLRVTVSDTGPGIPEAQLADIFRPFYTTKEQGLGMGLAISRSLVEAHAGTLTAENQPGGGALFTVMLWAVREDHPA
jgi:two-component system sensor kinase FixL